MSAYQYPTAAPGYPGSAAADPTAVMGRRIGAVVVDFVLYLLIMSFVGPTPLSPLAEYYDTSGTSDACEILQDDYDAVGCFEIGDRAYVTEGGDVAVQIVVWIAVVLLYTWVQGATGRTPGKALFGIKAVDEQGGTPGFGKSLLRTVLWAVDAAPWCLPLVGFITGLTTKGHRRVGDMAAKTFVVGKGHSGPVVVPGLATAATGGYPGAPGGYGAPGQPWGAPPPGAGGPQAGWGGPPQGQPSGGWGAPPAGTPGGPGVAGPGAGAGTGPTSGEQRPAPPSGWAAPGGAAPSETAPGGQSASSAPSSPASTSPSAPSGPSGGPSGGTPAGGAPTSAPTGAPDDRTTPMTGGPSSGAPSPGGADDRTTPMTGGPGSGGATSSGAPDDRTTPMTGGATPGQQAAAPGGATPGEPSSTGGQAPAGGATPAQQQSSTTYSPQWDAARGTYIVWDPNRGKWLGWDEAGKEWKPL